MDKTLGLKLELVTAFGGAAQEAVSQLRNVRTGLEELSKVKTDLTGLSELAKQITSLNTRAKAAADRVQAMGGVINTAGTQARAAAVDLNATAAAAEKVEQKASAAAKAALNLGTALSGLHTISVDSVGYAMSGIQQKTLEAKSAADKLTDSLLRLAAAKERLMLGSGSMMALPGPASYTALNYGGSTPMLNPAAMQAMITAEMLKMLPRVASYGPFTPGTQLPGSERRALGPGQAIYDNQLITTRYGSGAPIAQGQDGPPQLPPSNQKMLPGSTDPNWTRGGMYPAVISGGGSGGGGGKPPIDWHSFYGDMGGAGSGMKRWGQELQSNGMAAAINAAMFASVLGGMVKTSSDVEDLLMRTKEALKASGASEGTADKLLAASRKIAVDNGSNYEQTVGGMYNFVSAMPADVQSKINDPRMMQQIIEGYSRVSKLIVAGSSSQHQISMEEGALDANNLIANLGFDTSTPEKYAQAMRDSTNTLINIKNRTSNEVDTAAAAFKAIGPLAKQLHIDPSEIVGLVGMEGEGKLRGQPAGMAIKRLLMRQMLPAAKTSKLIDLVHSLGGDISLYDDKGNTRPLLDVLGSVNKFMDSKHLPDRERGMITGQLAGLYAISPEGLMLDQIKKHQHDVFKDPKTGKVYHGAAAYGKSLIHGTIAGGKTGDATLDSYDIRSHDFKTESTKTMNHFKDMGFSVFKSIEPDLMAVMQTVNKMITAFDNLPGPVKRAIGDFGLLALGASAFLGVGGMLFGNTLKLAGSFVTFAGNAGEAITAMRGGATAVEAVSGSFGKGAGLMMKAVSGLSGVAMSVFSGIGNGAIAMGQGVARGFTMMMAGMGPVGWALLALTAVIALVAVAWNRDWFGIREKTAAVWSWMVNEGKAFASGISKTWQQVGPTVITALEMMFPMLGMLDPKFRAKAGDMMQSLGSGFIGGVRWVLNGLGNVASVIWSTITNWGAQAMHAGEAFIANLGKGITNGIKSAPALVKAGLQKIRDLFPGSEPRDSSSPLSNMAHSGTAMFTNFASGIPAGAQVAVATTTQGATQVSDAMSQIDALFSPRHKSAKTKKAHAHKPIMDEIITLKDESVKAIESAVDSMEKAIEAGGGRVSKKWLDLVQGMHSTRFYGNAALTHTAIKHIDADPSARNARDYLDGVTNMMTQYPQVMKKLSEFLAASTTAHSRALISKMIGIVQKEHTAAIAKFMAPFEKNTTDLNGQKHLGMTAMQSLIGSENKKGDTFDSDQQTWEARLQRDIDIRKNKEMPSIKELTKYLTDLGNEKKQLGKIYDDEQLKLAVLQVSYDNLQRRIDGINGTDKQSLALKAQLKAQLQGLGLQIGDVNDRLAQQKNVLDAVDSSLNKTTDDIRKARAGLIDWQTEINSAFGVATKSAVDAFSSALENDINSKMMKMFGKWSQSGSPIMQAIGTFVQSFVGSLTSSIIDKIMQQAQNQLTTWFTQLSSMWFGGGSKNPMAGLGFLRNADGSLTATGGGSAGMSVGSSVTLGVLAAAGIGGGIGSILGQGTGAQSIHSTNGAIGGVAGGVAGGLGALLLGLGGGAMGGLGAGLAMFTPAGWGLLAAGILGGAVLGGSIGPHWGPASNYPDRSDPTYSGFLKQYNSGAGDTGFQIEDWLKNTNPASLSGDQLAMYNYFKGLGGANGDLGIANEHNGVFTLGSGQTANVADFRSKVDGWQQAMQKNTAALTQNAQNADRLAASFTSLILGGPAGFSMPAFLGSLTSAAQVVSNLVAPGGKPLRSGAPVEKQPGDITISVLQGATITSDIQGEIQNALPAIAAQLRAVINRSNYQQSRLYGDYVSQTG